MEHRAGVSPRGSSEQPETQSWCAPACCFEFINLSAKQYGAPTLYCTIYTSTYYWQVGTDKPLWPLQIFTLGYILPAAAHWLLTWRGWWVRPKNAAAASILYHETWLLSLCKLVITWHESLISKVLSGNSLVVQWLGLWWSRFNPWLGNPEKHNPPSPLKGAFSIWCSSAFETKGVLPPVLSSNRIYALSSVQPVSLHSSSTCGRAGTQEPWALWHGPSLLILVQVRTQL